MSKVRFEFGSIIEILDQPENDNIYLVVSKERYNEDAVQIKIPRNIAEAMGKFLTKSNP